MPGPLKQYRRNLRESLSVGTIVGRLTITQLGLRRGEKPAALCKCECGAETVVTLANLTRVVPTRSCGCLQKDAAAATGRLTGPVNGVITGEQRRKPPGVSGFNALYRSYQNNARFRNLSFSINKDDFKLLTSKPCVYCGVGPNAVMKNPGRKDPTDHSHYRYNGLDRVDPTEGYHLSNVVPCCKICNVAKMSQGLDEFKAWVMSVYKHLIQGETK